MNREDYIVRAKEFASRGESRPNAVMSPEKVRYIRKNPQGKSSKKLAEMLGCHYRTVQKVQYFETWTHI